MVPPERASTVAMKFAHMNAPQTSVLRNTNEHADKTRKSELAELAEHRRHKRRRLHQ